VALIGKKLFVYIIMEMHRNRNIQYLPDPELETKIRPELEFFKL